MTDERGDMAIQAHCLRVATWASELASAIGLSESDRSLVEQAAIVHHTPEILVFEQARGRLLNELDLPITSVQPLLSSEIRVILQALWGRRPVADPALAKIVAVLQISDDFDRFFESEPLFDADSTDPVTNSSVEAMMSHLRVASHDDVRRVVARVPVFPRAAREVLKQAANPDAGPRELELVASLDPVLAGRLIQTANSAFYSPRLPIGTIFHAVSFIGMETSRRVLLAAAIRGSFSFPQAHQIWNHSLGVAQTAELVAMHAPVKIDPSQAFLAGLMHDIGRLAFAMMPAQFEEHFQRLTHGGCPTAEVEICLSGRDHGEIGADTLSQWKFPPDIIEAVRWHHRPERTSLPLASLLYLAEFLTDSEEDLPSCVRMNIATRLTHISMGSLVDIRQRNSGSLESLRFVA